MFALVAWLGCTTDALVPLDGIVYASHEPSSGTLARAELRFVNFVGEAVAQTETDDAGAFVVDVPAGQPIFVLISGEDYATSVFPGTIGVEPQTVEPRTLYGVSLDERQGWLDRFAGCPGFDDDGAIAVGEVRWFGIADPYTGENPLVDVAFVSVVNLPRETTLQACYADAEGVAWDPEASQTGAAGEFAVFGIPPFESELYVEALLSAGAFTADSYPIWAPDEPAVVSPWYPAWAEFLVF